MQTIPVLGGRYRLGPEIGSGGMGAVHRAWDERFEREVAIKIVKSGDVEKERLRREAQYLAHLDHPNLVAVLDAGEDVLRRTDSVWFAMELMHGPDLRTVLRQDGPMRGADVRRVLTGVLAALDVLHAAGVVHRDMKPANVLLTAETTDPRWDVKLVDLGIAQHIRTDHLTSTGQIVGTAAYLSPEQVRGHEIGPATDVYALGLLAIEALSGRIAFPGGPAESATARLVRAPDLPPAVDPSWRRVLAAMTAIDPAARPAVRTLMTLVGRLPDDAQSLAGADLPTQQLPVVDQDRPTAVLETTSWRPAVRERRRPRKHLLAVACLLLALVAAGGWIAALTGGGGPTAAAVVTTRTHGPSPATSERSAAAPSRSAKAKAATTVVRPPAPAPTITVTAAAREPVAPVQQVATTEERAGKWLRLLRDRLHHPRGPHH